MVERVLDSMLIEGFDPEKLKELQEQSIDQKGWKDVYGAYQNNKILQANVESIEKIGAIDCAIVKVEDVRGIIPQEYFGVNNKREMRMYMGRAIAFKVESYDREAEVFTGSRIAAKEQMAEITLKRIDVEDVVPAVIRRVKNYALFADIGGIGVEIPINEVRYGWIDNLEVEYNEGDHIFVKVLEIKDPVAKDTTDGETDIEAVKEDDNDKEELKEVKAIDKKVIVSAKATQDNPWNGKVQKFIKGNEYVGTVSGVAEFGIFVNLEDGIDSVSRHLKFENVKVGDKVVVRILSIDDKEKQIRSRIVRII